MYFKSTFFFLSPHEMKENRNKNILKKHTFAVLGDEPRCRSHSSPRCVRFTTTSPMGFYRVMSVKFLFLGRHFFFSFLFLSVEPTSSLVGDCVDATHFAFHRYNNKKK